MSAPTPVPAGWSWSADEVRQVGHRAVDIIAEYLSGLPERPVFQPYPGELVRALTAEPIPAHGADVNAVLDDFVNRVAPYPFGNGHPRFFAWVNSPPHVLGVFAEALAAAMNPSVAGGNHAAVHVEHQVVRWFADAVGFPDDSTGLLVSGGSMATLTAFTVARPPGGAAGRYRRAIRGAAGPRAAVRAVPGHRRPRVCPQGR